MDAKNNVTLAQYDTVGNLVAVTSPDAGRREWRYCTGGYVCGEQSPNARNAGANVRIQYGYDRDRLISVTYPNATGNPGVTYRLWRRDRDGHRGRLPGGPGEAAHRRSRPGRLRVRRARQRRQRDRAAQEHDRGRQLPVVPDAIPVGHLRPSHRRHHPGHHQPGHTDRDHPLRLRRGRRGDQRLGTRGDDEPRLRQTRRLQRVRRTRSHHVRQPGVQHVCLRRRYAALEQRQHDHPAHRPARASRAGA